MKTAHCRSFVALTRRIGTITPLARKPPWQDSVGAGRACSRNVLDIPETQLALMLSHLNSPTVHYRGTVRRAFTLLELVVALSLAALIMIALVGVLRSVDRQLDELKARSSTGWTVDVERVLHRDLLSASSIRTADGWIWLEGSFTSYRNSAIIVKRVGYKCVPWLEDSEMVLVRVADGRREPLTVGPIHLIIERLDASGVPQPLSEYAVPTPNAVRAQIWLSDSEAAIWVSNFVLH